MNYPEIDPKEFQRGRIAAQLNEDCPADCSFSFWYGYLTEIYYPSGGLTPQNTNSDN